MSEGLQARWQPSGDLQGHMDHAQEALAVMQNQVILPADHRWQLAYSLLATGRGQDSGVMALGTFGTVKTTMGNLMLGADQRISLNGTDTEATLFGHMHPNPTADGPRYVHGKFKVVQPHNPAFYLNELTHMRNQKPVQQLWDGEELVMPAADGSEEERIDLQDAVYYITSNYPNGRDVFRLSQSVQSRIGAEVLTGDVDDITARRIQSVEGVSFADAPILPSAEVRRELSEMVTEAYPNPVDRDGVTVTGNFTVDLVTQLNESGLVTPISPADARLGKALASASRAYLFAHREAEGTEITPMVVARVAALVLPTVVRLSSTAEGNISDYLERNVGDLDKAIAARRLIAREAFGIAFRYLARQDEIEDVMGAEDARVVSVLSPREIAARVEDRVDSFSYADRAILGYDIDTAVAGTRLEVAAPVVVTKRGLRGLRNRRSQ